MILKRGFVRGRLPVRNLCKSTFYLSNENVDNKVYASASGSCQLVDVETCLGEGGKPITSMNTFIEMPL